MDEILGSAGNLLVAHHVLEPNKGDVVDDLGPVDQLIDVEVPVRPAPTDRYRPVEAAGDPVTVRERDQLSTALCSCPCVAAADHIEVVRGFDDPPNDQRSTSKHCVVAHGKIERAQEVEEVLIVGGHEAIVEIPRDRVDADEDTHAKGHQEGFSV